MASHDEQINACALRESDDLLRNATKTEHDVGFDSGLMWNSGIGFTTRIGWSAGQLTSLEEQNGYVNAVLHATGSRSQE
jgi:hypothetical protein